MTIRYEIKKMASKHNRVSDDGGTFLYSFGKHKWLTYEEAVALKQKYDICKSQLWDNEVLVCY